jgi:hypothetical protein
MRRLHPSFPVFFYLIAFFTFPLTPLFSQNPPTVTVGQFIGTNTSTTYPTPYGGSHEGMRAQYLYLASELTAAGVQPGLISTLGFVVDAPNGCGPLDNFKIKLSHTSLDSLAAGQWQAAGLEYYDTTGYFPVNAGNLHQLDPYFEWDGVRNLLIDVCHNPTSPGAVNAVSANASVQLTTNLPQKMSRTYALDDYPGICAITDPLELGNPYSRPVLLIKQNCSKPTNLVALSVFSQLAVFQATAQSGAQGYIWKVGTSGFSPDSNVGVVASDTTLLPVDTFFNLVNSASLDVYVRTQCGGGFVSEWAGPLSISTPPGCGDLFFDLGGNLADYAVNTTQTLTVCADSANQVAKIKFDLVALGQGDSIRIYNGTDISFPKMATLGGNILLNLPTYTATNYTGCLTLTFSSDATGVAAGYGAQVLCGLPDSCFDVPNMKITGLTATQAKFGWTDGFNVDSVFWELRIQGSGALVNSGKTTAQTLTINGLTEATYYTFFYRSKCSDGDLTPWKTINFFTPLDCAGATLITCGQFGLPVISNGPGIYTLNDCSGATVGQESLFKFKAPHTQMYNLNVFSTTNSNIYVSYLIKEANAGCDDQDWDCIALMNSVESDTFGPLIAGKTYFILADVQSTVLFNQTFNITGCGPTNDEAWQAKSLTLGAPCSTNIYANTGATYYNTTPKEPRPDTVSTAVPGGRWLTAPDATVWFSFVAPASGSVIISADSLANGGQTLDTQIALYEATNVNDYGTFSLLVSDDDNGTVGLGYSAILTYSGLTAGQTYYLQVDGFSTSQGPFCIQVEEGVIRVADEDCSVTYSAAPVKGTIPGGDRWYGVYTQPNILDLGDIVAAIKPGNQDLDSVFVRVDISDTIPNTPSLAYMPMYFHFSWSNTQATAPVQVRLFYKNQEFADLKTEANQPAATIDDLVSTYYTGTNMDCFYGNNNYVTGTATLINNVQSAALGTSGMFYLELSIPGPGEVSAHLGAIALPLELLSFKGRAENDYNQLEWTTSDERQLQWHVLERSTDGILWREAGRLEGRNVPGEQEYFWTDRNPPARAYYRLHSVDFDGTAAVSPAVFIERPATFGILAVYPSPVADQLTLDYQVEAESEVQVLISTLDGRLLEQRKASAVKGANQIQLRTGDWPPGMYLLQIRSDVHRSELYKVIKK